MPIGHRENELASGLGGIGLSFVLAVRLRAVNEHMSASNYRQGSTVVMLPIISSYKSARSLKEE
jgi:hypothetical protein